MRAGILLPSATLLALMLSTLAGCAHRSARESGPGADAFFTNPPPQGVLSPAPAGPGDYPPARRATPQPVPAHIDSVVVDTTQAPGFGDYVYVEELPEAIMKVEPTWPPAAKATSPAGTVMVQALVKTDGSVGDVRVVKGITGLDEAAMACVRQWKFKPALGAGGKPVAVWVGVPVKFDPPSRTMNPRIRDPR
jgi:TonB family protein